MVAELLAAVFVFVFVHSFILVWVGGGGSARCWRPVCPRCGVLAVGVVGALWGCWTLTRVALACTAAASGSTGGGVAISCAGCCVSRRRGVAPAGRPRCPGTPTRGVRGRPTRGRCRGRGVSWPAAARAPSLLFERLSRPFFWRLAHGCRTSAAPVVLPRLPHPPTHRPARAVGSGSMHPSKMKVDELRKELKRRGASTTGNKAALVQRLQEVVDAGIDLAATVALMGSGAVCCSGGLAGPPSHRRGAGRGAIGGRPRGRGGVCRQGAAG